MSLIRVVPTHEDMRSNYKDVSSADNDTIIICESSIIRKGEDSLMQQESCPQQAEGKYLMTLLVSITVSQLMFLNIATFMPLHIKERGLSLNSADLGIILSMY